MSEQTRSPTQIYREVQAGQAAEHVARIQALEARVRELEGELASLRRGGGTAELQRLPEEALAGLLRVFDAVPIPDLGAWERRQAAQRLSALLADVELPEGAFSGGETPAARVAEGDGAAVARITGAVVQVLSEVASRYLAQTIEYQGVTPDEVARARASHLVDVSALVDVEAQFGLLPPEGQRALFEAHLEQLILAKDQLFSVTRWMAEARELARGLAERRGLQTARGATLLALLRALAAQDELDPPRALLERLRALHARLAALLPERAVLEALELGETTYQRAHASLALDEAGLQLVAESLSELLADHEAVAGALRASSLATRARQALNRLAKAAAGSPAAARAALEPPAARLAAVEAAQARSDEAQRALVKRVGAALEREARARIAASERPEAAGAAFERLSKGERTAYLIGLWHELLGELRAGLGALEALDAAEVEGRSRSAPPGRILAPSALEALVEALRCPEDAEGGADLSLATPIDVEEGLLQRQAADLAARVEELLRKYSRSPRSGLPTLEVAAAKLTEIDALSSGKKLALDKLLRKAHQGKHSPKREAQAARALLEEQRAVEEGARRVAARKAAALEQVRPRLEALGLAEAGASYDALWKRLASERERRAAAEATRQARAEHEARLASALARLGAEDAGGAPSARARALLAEAGPDAHRLRELASALEAARAEYLTAANRVLRRRAPDFNAARAALEQVARDLEAVDALQRAAEAYAAAWSAQFPRLSTPDKVLSHVRREGSKAALLRTAVETASGHVTRAAAKLDAPGG